MKQLLIIKVQSLTDLITNSSSELFQLQTDQSVEQVEEILSKITEGYCKPILFNLKYYRENRNKYSEMIDAIRPKDDDIYEEFENFWIKIAQINKDNPELYLYDTISEYFFDPESPEDVRCIYEDYLCHELADEIQREFKRFVIKNDYLINKNVFYNKYNIRSEAFDKFIESHNMPDIHFACRKSLQFIDSIDKLDGCILVLSKEDNSIPYGTWDAIKTTFNTTNYHLG